MSYTKEDMMTLGLNLCSNIEHALREAKLGHIADQLEKFGAKRTKAIIQQIDEARL